MLLAKLRFAFLNQLVNGLVRRSNLESAHGNSRMLGHQRNGVVQVARFQQQKDQLTAASETGAEHQAELASNALSAQLLEQEIARSQLSSLQAELARLRGEKEQIQREAERQR